MRRQAALQDRLGREDALTMRSRTRSMLLGLGFTEPELAQPLATLSGGQRNKAQLARLLLSQANLLLLDEPTNHLDMDGIRYLEDFLRGYAGTFMVISHDRYFLDRVTTRTMELKHGRLLQSNGSYTRHLELTADRNEILRRHYENQKKEIRRLEGVIEQQRRWNQAHNYVTIASKQKQIDRLKAALTPPEADTAPSASTSPPRSLVATTCCFAMILPNPMASLCFPMYPSTSAGGNGYSFWGPTGAAKPPYCG